MSQPQKKKTPNKMHVHNKKSIQNKKQKIRLQNEAKKGHTSCNWGNKNTDK